MCSKKNPVLVLVMTSHEATAFAEIISYSIKDIRLIDETIIKLFQVVYLYKSCPEQLGGDISQKIHATLKEKLIAQMIWKLMKADDIYHKH